MDRIDILISVCVITSIFLVIKFGRKKTSIYRIVEDIDYRGGTAFRAEYYIQRKSLLFGFIPYWGSLMDSDSEYANQIRFTSIQEAEKFIVKLKAQDNMLNGTVRSVIKEIKI